MAIRRWSAARILRIWLDVSLILGGLAWIILVVWLLISPVAFPGVGGDVRVTVALGSRTFVPILTLDIMPSNEKRGLVIRRARIVKGYGDLRLETTAFALHRVSMSAFVGWIPMILLVVWLVRQVLASVLAGEPFARANSRRLWLAGMVLLLIAFAGPVVEYFMGRWILSHVEVVDLALSPAFRFSPDAVSLALLFFVWSAVSRHGSDLEDERRLTV